jgi:N-acetylglutamate synthase-like GNAT family acetyltransferase
MIHIQPYDPLYQQGVVDTILPIQTIEFKVAVTLADQPDLLDIPGFYQSGNGNFWVAVADGSCGTGEVVGTIALRDFGNGQGALRKMFVKAPHRGSQSGVAARLLEELLVWSRQHGMREIYLGTVPVLRAAHRFYEKNGFELIAAEQLPPTFPRMAVDTVFYLKHLTGA